jgi:DNA (cytosine-5)-methyltransferase 1
MAKSKKLTKHKFKAVDFFCSGGGMTAGFRMAGVKVLGGIDIDEACKKTYIDNNPDSIQVHLCRH